MTADAVNSMSAASTKSYEQLEQELFETRRLLSLIMENNPFAIFWKDCNLVYQGCNMRFAKIAGLDSPTQVAGKTDFDMPWGMGNEVGAEACRESDMRVITSGREEMHIIELIQQENGDLVWTDASKVPMFDREGKVVGVLGTMEDITERKLAQQALEEANSKLEELSRIDSLTQVANRRYFSEVLEREWSRAAREQREFAVILFDIDHFKQFNDRHGHLAGDHCLTAVATAAKSVLRRSGDFIARYGGEEFVVILPGTSLNNAQAIAEEMRLAIAKLALEPGPYGQPVGVSISLGVAACLARPSSSPIPLLSCADQALYAAKKSGRNQVQVAHSTL